MENQLMDYSPAAMQKFRKLVEDDKAFYQHNDGGDRHLGGHCRRYSWNNCVGKKISMMTEKECDLLLLAKKGTSIIQQQALAKKKGYYLLDYEPKKNENMQKMFDETTHFPDLVCFMLAFKIGDDNHRAAVKQIEGDWWFLDSLFDPRDIAKYNEFVHRQNNLKEYPKYEGLLYSGKIKNFQDLGAAAQRMKAYLLYGVVQDPESSLYAAEAYYDWFDSNDLSLDISSDSLYHSKGMKSMNEMNSFGPIGFDEYNDYSSNDNMISLYLLLFVLVLCTMICVICFLFGAIFGYFFKRNISSKQEQTQNQSNDPVYSN